MPESQDAKVLTVWTCSRCDETTTSEPEANMHATLGAMHVSVPIRYVPESEYVPRETAEELAEALKTYATAVSDYLEAALHGYPSDSCRAALRAAGGRADAALSLLRDG